LFAVMLIDSDKRALTQAEIAFQTLRCYAPQTVLGCPS
jgi:hypothetical protein